MMNLPTGSSLRAYLMMVITTMCWGANTVLGQLAVGEVSPMLLVTLRWVGVVILLLIFASHSIRDEWPVLRERAGFILVMGTLGFTGFNSLFYLAAHSTSAVNMGILQGSMPMIVILATLLCYGTPITRYQMAGVTITMLGVVIVAAAGDLSRLAELAISSGDLLMLAACVFYAGYTVGLRQRPAVSAMTLFFALSVVAMLTSLPLTAIEAALGLVQWPSAQGWLVIAAVMLLPSFLAQILFINSVALIGPSRAGVFVNLVPVFGAIMAVTFLNEPFRLFHGISLTLVLGGIALAEYRKPSAQ